MPLPVPIDRGVHTTRTALPDCAQSRESATVRNFRQSTRGGGAAETANTTIAPQRALYGSAPGDSGRDDTRSSSGPLNIVPFSIP
jgi:hypothetical protein